ERDLRRLVHLAVDLVVLLLLLLGFLLILAGRLLLRLLLRILRVLRVFLVLRRGGALFSFTLRLFLVEHVRRQVVDLQQFASFERFLAGEVVIAGLELEIHEVGLGDEARLVDRRRAQRGTLAFGGALGVALGAVLAPVQLALHPLLFVGAAIGLGNGDAVEAHGA